MNSSISVGMCLVLFTVLFTSGTANGAQERFHSGTTGRCEGCHAFGEELAGRSKVDQRGSNAAGAGNYNLRGSDSSSTCLSCHEAPAGTGAAQGYYVSTASADLQAGQPPLQLTPGGDFGWLKKSYRWNGGAAGSPGARHGHNIVAADNGYAASGNGALSCISCHDPHGNYRRNADGSISASGLPIKASGSYADSPDPDAGASVGSYRMLAGKGYLPKTLPDSVEFVADPPAAVTPAAYNRAESPSDTRVAYGSGMSEWCQNCHTLIHTEGGDQHAAGNGAKFTAEIASNYNNYVKSGDLNGSQGSSYSSLVPYEMGTDDYAVLKTTANSDGSDLAGPAGGRPNVMCLSCHRAHASGWDGMTRWNTTATFMVENGGYPGIDNRASADDAQGRTEAETRKAYCDRPASRFATFQRSMCNKCHAKD